MAGDTWKDELPDRLERAEAVLGRLEELAAECRSAGAARISYETLDELLFDPYRFDATGAVLAAKRL